MSVPATTYLQETILLRNQIEQGFIELAKRLHEIKTEKLWEGNYDSYQEFLADMRLSEATDSKLRLIYTRFVLDYAVPKEQLASAGWSNLYLLASKVEDKTTALSLLEQARDLKRDDFAMAVREVAVGYHKCIESEKIVLAKCGICGAMHRIK